ncbi:unnamed protein product, partial [marine sediment metagenome]
INVTTDVSYAGQIPPWLTVTQSGSGNSQTLTNSVTLGSLTQGTYTCTVSVAAVGASNSPKSYIVTLVVEPSVGISIEPDIVQTQPGLYRVLVPAGFRGKWATVSIFSVHGKIIRRMNLPVSGSTLNINWNGTTDNRRQASSGIYYVTVNFGSKTLSTRGILF